MDMPSLPGRTCPFFVARTGHIRNMSSPGSEQGACPGDGGGYGAEDAVWYVPWMTVPQYGPHILVELLPYP